MTLRIAIVTGAAQGIGEAISNALAAVGVHVVVGDTNDKEGQLVASRIKGQFVHLVLRCIVAPVRNAVHAGLHAVGCQHSLVAAIGVLATLIRVVINRGLGRRWRMAICRALSANSAVIRSDGAQPAIRQLKRSKIAAR